MDGAKDDSSNISGKLQIESNQKTFKLISGIRLKTIKQPLLLKNEKGYRGLKTSAKSKIKCHGVPKA